MRLTYDDLIRFDRDGKFIELINGVLYNHPAPCPEHQIVAGNLYLILGNYIREKKTGKVFFAPIDVILSKTDVVQPDIIFISTDNLKHLKRVGFEGVPDLVVEIISEYTGQYDRERKKALYATYACKNFWLIDPFEKKIELYEFHENKLKLSSVYLRDQSFHTHIFPDLKISCPDLFEGV